MFYTLFLLQGAPQGTQSTFTATWTHGRGTKGPFRLRPICLQHCDNTNLKTAAQTYSMADQQFFYCHFTKALIWSVRHQVTKMSSDCICLEFCHWERDPHGVQWYKRNSWSEIWPSCKPSSKKEGGLCTRWKIWARENNKTSINVAFRLIGQKCLQRSADWLTVGRPSCSSSIRQSLS